MSATTIALSHYTNAARYIMEVKEASDDYFILMKELLSPLRFYLACRVCNKLLQDPMSPDHTACQHTVCSQCVGGKMKLKPSCGWCQSYDNFLPNMPLASLLHSFSKLCDYVLSSGHYEQQLKHAPSDAKIDIPGYKKDVAEILNEGVQYSGLTKNQELEASDTASANAALVSTITPEPTIQRPSIKLTIRNPFKDRLPTNESQSPASMSNNKTTEQKEAVLPLTAAVAEKDSSNSNLCSSSATLISPERNKKTPRKLVSLSLSEEDTSGTLERPKKKSKIGEKRGCGCGNATTTPGKLTCYGQRCPCYSSHNPCLDCRCKGCRNPNKYVKIEKATEDTDIDEINVE